jgi:Tol biopolymer transport system component
LQIPDSQEQEALEPMRPKRSRALVGTTIAAALAAATLAGPAQANTTLPGLNGKIAFTTDADTVPAAEITAAPTKGTDEQTCYAPIPVFSVLALGGGDLMWCGAEINTINPDGSGQTAVTNDFGSDDSPAWSSQNGSSIAYQSSKGETCDSWNPTTCNYDIWVSNADGSGSRQLTSGVLNEVHPSFSPDDSKIAFDGLNPIFAAGGPGAATKEVDPIAQQLDHVLQTIYTMPASGGTPSPLEPASEIDFTQNGNNLVSDSQPAWSPDGTQIAFTRLVFKAPEISAAVRNGKLALSSFTVNAGIYVAPAAGGASHQIGTTQDCQLPGFDLPIVVQTTQSADPQAAAAARSQLTRDLTTDCVFDVAPAWSPDGSKLAFERITFGTEIPEGAVTKQVGLPTEDSDIVVMSSSDGSGEVNLSNLNEANCSGSQCGWDQKPAWSPDGTKIAFFSDRGADGSFTQNCEDTNACDDEIWVMNADGSSPTQLTNNDVNDINPDWQRIPPPPAPPAPPAAPAAAPKVGVAGVRRACVSKSFHLRFTVATSSAVKSVVVKLDGRKIKTTTKSTFTLTVNSKKLKAGRHRLTITATDSAGHVTTSRKTFSVCKAAKPRRKAAPRFTG